MNNEITEAKVIKLLIKWGNNEAEVMAMVKSQFKNAISYGFKTPARIAEYIRTVA
jgi:hypothetical protein